MAVAMRLVKVGLLIWLLTVVSVCAVSLFWGRNAPLPDKADAIICLGAGMLAQDSAQPGPASARRAMTCAKLHMEGVAPVIIFSGFGNALNTVADAMAELASTSGVPASAIFVEPDARSTIQNAAFSRALLPEGANRVLLVSDAFHLPRSWVIFRLLGYPEVLVHVAQRDRSDGFFAALKEDIQWNLRESVVIWVNVGRAVVYWAGGILGVDPAVRIGWFN